MRIMMISAGPACQKCKATARRFAQNGVPLEEYTVITAPSVMQEALQSGAYKTAPVVAAIDGDEIVSIWQDFRPDMVDKASAEWREAQRHE